MQAMIQAEGGSNEIHEHQLQGVVALGSLSSPPKFEHQSLQNKNQLMTIILTEVLPHIVLCP